MTCLNGVHLDLVHFAVGKLPMLVVRPADDEHPRCEADELGVPGEDGSPIASEVCTEEAFADVAFPGDDEEGGHRMGVVALCRNHLALLVLQSEEMLVSDE